YLKGEWYGEEGQKLDITGCLLYAFAIFSLVYGASRMQSGVGVLLVLTGAVLLLIFVLQQKRSRYPVFEVALFSANKVFTFSSFAALLNYSASYAVTFLISLYLQYMKGMSPQAAGSVLMAQPVVMALFSPFAGRLSDRIEPRLLATAGMTLTVIGVLLFSRVQPNTPLVLIVANLMLLGSGFALFSSPNMSAIMGAVEKHHYGLASGVVATMRVLGQMCSMTVVTLVFALFVGREAITPANFDQFLQSIHTVFMISACFCLCGIYFSWFRGSVLSAEKSAL
ncbi:MAG: MFS transporter, partial [Desulfobulbaceae bacterium]|nr:MFS transporter [Desulfobulbaceae bacterium]